MAGTGDTFAFPDGSDYTITASAGETGGSLVEMELLLPPNAVTPPLHAHPRQEEDFEVLSGDEETIVPAKRGQRAVMGLFARVGRRKS